MTPEQIEAAYDHCTEALGIAMEARAQFVAYMVTLAIIAILESAEDATAAA